MKPITLDHLTVLEVRPPDFFTLGADAGYPAVGVRLNSPLQGGVEYRLRADTPVMKETLQRMADTDVRVFDIEVLVLAPDTDVAACTGALEATLEDAAELVSQAGKSNGAILLDPLHLIRSDGGAASVKTLDPRSIGSVQPCDAPLTRLSSLSIIDEARTDRSPPGEGELPLPDLLDALPVEVPLAVEVPLTRRHPHLTRRVRAATHALLEAIPHHAPAR